jgi:hypothetical protein
MEGNSALDGTNGNIRTFTAGGVSVHVSAFSRDKSSGDWSTAYLGSYGGGLGVTDEIEGNGSNNTHTVDNVGRDNYVLFEFSEQVIVDSAFLGYVVDDSDVKVWIGTLPDAFNSHQTLSDAVLSSLGFTEVNLADHGNSRTADLNAGELSGNVLVIAADPGDTTPDDRFKIELLKVVKATPGVYENKAVVTVPGAQDSDLSHYRNPDAPPAPDGGEGLTPGFWKQKQHFKYWFGFKTWYSYEDVFDVEIGQDKTLLQALSTGGGGMNALLRHSVAALLNASNSEIDYKYTVNEVIAMVQEAFETGDFETTKDLFEAQNELGLTF